MIEKENNLPIAMTDQVKQALAWGVVELVEARITKDPSKLFDGVFMSYARELIGEEFPELFSEEWHMEFFFGRG